MALFKNMTITYKGMALFAKAQAGQEIHFTKMQVGSGKMGTQNPITFISLLDPKLDVPIISINPNSELKSATIIGHITNKNVKEAMYICEIGLFAKDPDDGEILYGYVNCGEYGDYYAPQSQGPYSWQYEISAAIGNAANVTAELSQIQWDYGVKNSNNNFKELKGSNQKEINESIDELLLSTNKKIEQIELTAEKVTITDTENNFTSGQVEGALKECITKATTALNKAEQAFQSADNGKKLISETIGQPLSATDQFTTMSTKIQTMKNAFVENLSAKGQSANENENLYDLISKIKNIELGRKVATGNFNSYSTNVEVNYLSFTPTLVLIVWVRDDSVKHGSASEKIGNFDKDVYIFNNGFRGAGGFGQARRNGIWIAIE